MKNLFTNAINLLKFISQTFEFKRFFAIALVGFLVLTTSLNSNIDSGRTRDTVIRTHIPHPKCHRGKLLREKMETRIKTDI
jgi:hypothetical protein